MQRLGQAQAVRPEVVGRALAEIQREPAVAQALLRLPDITATLKSPGKIVLTEADTGLILNSSGFRPGRLRPSCPSGKSPRGGALFYWT